MRNHPDDDDTPPTLNKAIKETYEEVKSVSAKKLQGVPPAPINNECGLESINIPTEISSDGKSVPNTELHGVPCTPIETEPESSNRPNKETNVMDTGSQDTPNKSELCGAPDDTGMGHDGLDLDTNETNSVPVTPSKVVVGDCSVPQSCAHTDKDNLIASADSNLPKIEKTKPDNKITDEQDINLQSELNAENVTQPNTELLEELSEFSNLLNLDDDYLNADLPAMGELNLDQPSTNVGMDLEIAMDNAKFLEANPLHGSRTSSSGSIGKRSDIAECSRPLH